MTSLQRPLVVIYDLFNDSILDLSWSRDKNILLACSTDGTVAGLMFSEDELGTSLSPDDKVCEQFMFILNLFFFYSFFFDFLECIISTNVWKKCQY